MCHREEAPPTFRVVRFANGLVADMAHLAKGYRPGAGQGREF